MGKALSDMTLEELWELFPIFLTEHKETWNKWYENEQIRLYSFLPAENIIINHVGSTAILFAGLLLKVAVLTISGKLDQFA